MADKKEPTQQKQVIKAIIDIQSKMSALKKNAKGHNSNYLNLASLMDNLRPYLTEARLAVIQTPKSELSSGGCSIETRIVHEDGDEVSGIITVPMSRTNDPQSFGAAMTYGRRYALMAMFGLVTEDDDAQSSSMSLEKLLKELSTQYTSDDMYKIREEHLKHLKDNKFWNQVYSVMFDVKIKRIYSIEQQEKKEGQTQ
jgi:hypothetical protein